MEGQPRVTFEAATACVAFQAYTEPELERMANRLDGVDRTVVDGAVWAGFP